MSEPIYVSEIVPPDVAETNVWLGAVVPLPGGAGKMPIGYIARQVNASKRGIELAEKVSEMEKALADTDSVTDSLRHIQKLAYILFDGYSQERIENEILPRLTMGSVEDVLTVVAGMSLDVVVKK